MRKLTVFIITSFLATITYGQSCPSITVSGPTDPVIANNTFQFTAQVLNLGSANPTYNWSISVGTIESGQGTPAITVNPGPFGGNCTATVDLGGLPSNCSSMSSTTVSIAEAPQQIISTQLITAKSLNDTVKKFIAVTKLDDYSMSKNAIINIYSTGKPQFNNLKAIIEKAFLSKKILSYQFKIVDAGKVSKAKVDMLLQKN